VRRVDPKLRGNQGGKNRTGNILQRNLRNQDSPQWKGVTAMIAEGGDTLDAAVICEIAEAGSVGRGQPQQQLRIVRIVRKKGPRKQKEAPVQHPFGRLRPISIASGARLKLWRVTWKESPNNYQPPSRKRTSRNRKSNR